MTDAAGRVMATPTEPPVTVTEVIEPVVPYTSTEPPLVTTERSAIVSPVGWSAIFAAATVAVGTWLVLHLIGIGIGLTAIDPADASSLRRVGIGTGIWSLIAPILALFVGGLVAGRLAPTINTANAAIHGAVVWGLAAISAFVLLSMMMGSMVRGVAATGSAVGRTVAPAVQSLAQADISLSDLGLSGEDLVAPINERLRAQGMPPVTAKEIEAAARDALRSSIRQGEFDREALVTSLEQRTKLNRQEAEQIATQIEQRQQEVVGRVQEMAGQAQETVLSAAEATGKVLLLLSITALLALGAALLGSILTVRYERREHVVLPRATTVR